MDSVITLTPLRKDVMDIFIEFNKPLSAYEVLDKLKAKRPGAEPPTVYRVIDYFVEKKLLHRIETGNKYVRCSHVNNFTTKHLGILFLCQSCHLSFEYMDEKFLEFIAYFSKGNKLAVDDSLVEVKGTCNKCLGRN